MSQNFPQPEVVIQFFSDKHPSLRTAADMSKQLALPHRSFEALVRWPFSSPWRSIVFCCSP